MSKDEVKEPIEAPAKTPKPKKKKAKSSSTKDLKKQKEPVNVDEADENEHATEQIQAASKWLTWKKGIILGIIAILIIIASYLGYSVSSATSAIINKDDQTPLVEQLGIILGGEDKPLYGEEEDRVNVLLLGIGGAGHPGGNLTDSIMVASIKPSTNEVALLSLPRDLVVKIYDDNNPQLWEGRKINYAYELGDIELAKEKVSEVTGIDLYYYVLIDFSGFRQLVEDVDGVTVDVERSFTGLYGAKELSLPCPTAQLYNLNDGPYCAIQFNRGIEHMDGERSLIFSRVRKLAPGSLNTEEGSDFARGQRQQKILEGFKEQIFSSSTLLNPKKISDLLGSAGDHLETNMELWEMAKFGRFASGFDTNNIISRVVDDSTSGLLYSKIYEPTGAYVLVPQAGEYNFSEIHNLAEYIFENAETAKEEANIQVLNGTSKNGLAAQTAERLQSYDLEVVDIGNAAEKTYETSVIYDLSNGEKPLTLELLKETTEAEAASKSAVDSLLLSDPEEEILDLTADFIIILGTNDTDSAT